MKKKIPNEKSSSILIDILPLLGIILVGGLLLNGIIKGRSKPISEQAVIETKSIEGTSVMITNRAQNHGGTGVVLSSTTTESSVLTNRHVCKVIENGGVVLHKSGLYQVVSYIESKRSDLCLVKVQSDLGGQLSLARIAPKFYDFAQVSGHPNLFPNVITEGHVSGKEIIQVLIGMRKCTDSDYQDDRKVMYCVMMGGYPLIENYESTLVTATIMPGSSGSAVYNKDKELIGLVFAGNGNLGYAWTVPYEQVARFLNVESNLIKETEVDQTKEENSKEQEETALLFKKAVTICQNNSNEKLYDFCRILNRDVMWHK